MRLVSKNKNSNKIKIKKNNTLYVIKSSFYISLIRDYNSKIYKWFSYKYPFFELTLDVNYEENKKIDLPLFEKSYKPDVTTTLNYKYELDIYGKIYKLETKYNSKTNILGIDFNNKKFEYLIDIDENKEFSNGYKIKDAMGVDLFNIDKFKSIDLNDFLFELNSLL